MRRRTFITLLGGAAAAWPLAARAQQSEATPRIGVLMTLADTDSEGQLRVAAFRQELQKLGWIEGRNIRFEHRWAAGDAQRLRAYAQELVGMAPASILWNPEPFARPASPATSHLLVSGILLSPSQQFL
jgi:putative tryptophan/tyrosine transport system substrate-binding protein